MFVFKFFLSIFLVQKMRWWSDRDNFSLLLVKIYSMRMEVLNVTLIGTLISCFNITVEQNSKQFLISELITIFPLDVFSFFSNKFTPFCKIFIFMSPSTNISFSNMFKEFRISANNLKSCILRKSINYTYRYGLGFRN